MAAALESPADGILALSGVLDHLSAPALRESGRRLIAGSTAAQLQVDCSRLERSSSVGLSLLLCFKRDALAHGKHLNVSGLPAELAQLAGVSGLSELLAEA